MTATVRTLTERYPLMSGQVNKAQLAVILSELEALLVRGTPGAVMELGCYIGTTSLFIRRLLDVRGEAREFHAYDSFQGLPPKTVEDESRAGEQFKAGELAVSKKEFLRQFNRAGLRPPTIHKAWFKDLTPTDVPESIAFAFLDGDFYESIRDSLRVILPALSPGATIIIDDYAREALPGPAKAVRELLPGRPVTTIHNLGVLHI